MIFLIEILEKVTFRRLACHFFLNMNVIVTCFLLVTLLKKKDNNYTQKTHQLTPDPAFIEKRALFDIERNPINKS